MYSVNKLKQVVEASFFSARQYNTINNLHMVPRSVVKRFSPKRKPKVNVAMKPNRTENLDSPRFNHANIQMISSHLYAQIFNVLENNTIPPHILQKCLEDYKTFDINIADSKPVDDVKFTLPKLEGNTIEEHFYNIGEEQSKPYRQLILDVLKTIPSKPKCWLMKTGWIRYCPGVEPEKVDFPLEDCIIFDVEICVQIGAAPILATAVTSKAWYGWVSETLIEGSGKPVENQRYDLSDLIPFESTDAQLGKEVSDFSKTPRVVVGHNVSFDRARIKEQYWIQQTATRFVDTMSLHVCVSGITSYQRAVLKSGKFDLEDDKWRSCSSLNSLAEVHKLYCGSAVDKETRNIFVEGTLSDVKDNFQKLMDYCCGDVEATYNVLKVLFPMFLKRFPHPVTFAGMLEMGTAYLPVNSNWTRYITESEQTFEDLENEATFLLAKKADDACQLLHDFKFREDLWMWDQDWSIQELKIKKAPKKTKTVKQDDGLDLQKDDDQVENIENDLLAEKFKSLMDTKDLLPARLPLLPGYPTWYRKLCSKPFSASDWIPGPQHISTSMQITPKLLRLTWEGYPLHYIRGQGWGFLVPFSQDLDMATDIPLRQLIAKCPVVLPDRTLRSPHDVSIHSLHKDVQENLGKKEYYSAKKKDKTEGLYKGAGVWCNTVLEDCCYFLKLPHKDGVTHRVGNPLSKDFLNKFSNNVLAGDDLTTEQILSIARMLSYWRNNRDRISRQMVAWLPLGHLPSTLRPQVNFEYGAIIPQVVVCGTLTRRAMEPTWMTASNAHLERIGSELRGLVQAPPGYNIVGADVDSQELWIAAVIGDASLCQMHGATPFGWMTLSGSKSNGTDMHSVTARAIGISRDHAKVINYARIYGAGQNFAEHLLKQFNPSMSSSEARSKAMKMFALTKGKRVFQMRKLFLNDFVDRPYTSWEAMKLAKVHGLPLRDMFEHPKWVGGTESAMFNRLEEIAGDPSPVTPFLKGRLSRALEPETMSGERFLPTRVNWVVQSGAVDYLHLMLVSMRWLMKDRARFILSFHDEVRYLVPEEYRYKAALSMHITNLLTRAYCARCLGLNDLPMSVAFFTSVEVDTVLRKECSQDCKTPSNPHGLEKGYGISQGESLNIYETIKKTGGVL